MQRDMTDEIRHAVRVELARGRLTQGQLADRVGVSPQQLSRMMQGKSEGSVKAWQRVFDELGLELTVRPKED